MKSLVVYYSRTEITKKLAEAIARKTDADIEEIIPKVNYKGKIGYARGGKDAMSSKVIDIENQKFNPEDYDVVYLGCPVWASRPAAPLYSYLRKNEGKFQNVRFFLTAGSSGFEGAFKHMEEASVKPQKILSLTTKEVKKDMFEDSLNDFTA